jgi:SAM-dependent methyltransferase
MADAAPRAPWVRPRLLDALACPACSGGLAEDGDALRCEGCGATYPIEQETLRLVPERLRTRDDSAFYDAESGGRHGREAAAMPAKLRDPVEAFVGGLAPDALVLELGSGRGAFDQIHPGYVALDLSFGALVTHSTPPRIQGHAEALPFADGSVDAVFTVASLEHVPNPELALAEIARIVRPGGRAFVYPAWYVRPWTAKGLHTRPAAELPPADRLRKLTIPIRDRREYQFATRLPGRLAREAKLRAGRPVDFTYRRLDPELDHYVTSDSDAFTSMDPHAASAWFIANGFDDLTRPTPRSRILYGYEPVIVAKR